LSYVGASLIKPHTSMFRLKTNKKLGFNGGERQKRDAETEDELGVRLLLQRKISELLWTVLRIVAQ